MGKIKVAMFLSSLTNGGIERVVVNIVQNINYDRFKVYLFLLSDKDMHYRDTVLTSGAELVTEYPEIMRTYRGNKRWALFKCASSFLRKQAIDVVHIHCNNESPELLLASKINKIKTICMHSHSAYSKYWNLGILPWKSRVSAPVFRWLHNWIPTNKIGCSQMACVSMFGYRDDTEVMCNALDLSRFNANAYADKAVLQEKYGLNANCENIIFVGRFDEQKNPLFMIRAFDLLLKKNNQLRLTIVGHGEMEFDIYKQIAELELEDYIVFLPHDTNIPELLKAHDYFWAPSIREGVGIVFLEAQVMNIPAFATDAVPQEADLGLCEFISLDDGEYGYVEKMYACMLSYKGNLQSRKIIDESKLAAYRMSTMINRLEKIYSADNTGD